MRVVQLVLNEQDTIFEHREISVQAHALASREPHR
jgi:hypothetical protein